MTLTMHKPEVKLLHTRLNIHNKAILIYASRRNFINIIAKHWGAFTCKDRRRLKVKAVFHILSDRETEGIKRKNMFLSDKFIFWTGPYCIIACDFKDRPWQCYIKYSPKIKPETLHGYIFEPVFFNALKRMGIFHYHASCVSKNGRGILFAAPKECGKSTLALKLIHSGFKLVADDDVFLADKKGRVYATGNNNNLFLTGKTISLIPRFAFLKRCPKAKRGMRIKRMFAVKIPLAEKYTIVKNIVFPRISGSKKTKLTRTPKEHALIKLLKLEPRGLKDIFHDKISIDRYFNFTTKLNHNTKIYNLRLGRNWEEIVRLLEGIAN